MTLVLQWFHGYWIKSKCNKTPIDKQNYSILRSFCTTKETINRLKKQPMKWEKIVANHVLDKGLIFKTYKNSTTPQQKNQSQNQNQTNNLI